MLRLCVYSLLFDWDRLVTGLFNYDFLLLRFAPRRSVATTPVSTDLVRLVQLQPWTTKALLALQPLRVRPLHPRRPLPPSLVVANKPPTPSPPDLILPPMRSIRSRWLGKRWSKYAGHRIILASPSTSPINRRTKSESTGTTRSSRVSAKSWR